MTKRMIIMLAATLVVLGGVFGFQVFKASMIKKFMGMGQPPATITTIKATVEEWQPVIKAVGSLRAVKGADLAAESAGIVDQIYFQSGDDVEEGAMLLQLRSDSDRARLRALESAAKLAEITLQRDLKQLQSQAVSQATVDADSAALEGAKALVLEQRAVIEKKTVLAPFTGHLGIRAIDVGQYLASGTTVVTLQQLDPIYVDFFLPQQMLPKLKVGQKVVVTTDAVAGKEVEGAITALNAKIDPNTRNIQVRATLPNPDRALLPGMFANVAVTSGDAQRLVTLPQTAISYNPYGNTVYRIEQQAADEKSKGGLVARQSFVTTGETRGDQVAVLSGVKEGEEIASSGLMKLHNGSMVVVNNSVTPTNDPAPKPKDE